MKHRDENAHALFHRAGNAHVPVSVDTRPKTVPNKRRQNDRKKVRRSLRAMCRD